MANIGYYTSDSLIEAIKRKAMIPENERTFSEDGFLAMANEEMLLGIVPSVMSYNEEYYVYPIEVALVSETSNYEIPYRAIGGKLRDLFYRDVNGNLVEMSRISPNDKSMYQQTAVGSNFLFYYLEGNNIVLSPRVGISPQGTLVFTIHMRPSNLVSEDRVAIITAITTGISTTTYTVDAIPTGFSVSTLFDLLQAKPGHKIRKFDLTSTLVDIATTSITFNTSDIDTDTEVGDIIAFASECIIPQCPSDLQPMLAQRVAARCLEALGDTQGLTNANTKLQEMEMKTSTLIDNRVIGSPSKVVNTRGLLKSSRMRRRRWL